MVQSNILSIGTHPNIAFYNWRLFTAKTSTITYIPDSSSSTDPSQTTNGHSKNRSSKVNKSFQWSSPQFGNSRFTMSNVYPDLDTYLGVMANSNKLPKIDFIIVSASSLQELSNMFAKLTKLVQDQLAKKYVPTIIVESTNFVNLEPFIKMSLQVEADVPILSIMSDFDVRVLGNNVYGVHPSKKESELVYLGRSGGESEYTSQDISLINKVSDLFESAGIDVYKLNTPLEFLSL
ncbi:unnamed protein product [Ambrosiozyma monospora]|uniref:Unnamed protein product n=1 Tax=Ambrosiozyma monospora TaxID=43982 RepID=A0ACB5U2V1_AMBMO|nr:unnamed protein product [Ambrosiozyma monospora]